MGGLRRQQGYSLIGLLLTVAIVGILIVLSLKTDLSTLRGFQTGYGSGSSFKLNIASAQLRSLGQAEVMYYNVHRSYGTWEQLVSDGEIQRGYIKTAQGRGTPFIPYYDIDIKVTASGFVITASPNLAAGAVAGSSTLRIDETGSLEEVPTK